MVQTDEWNITSRSHTYVDSKNTEFREEKRRLREEDIIIVASLV